MATDPRPWTARGQLSRTNSLDSSASDMSHTSHASAHLVTGQPVYTSDNGGYVAMPFGEQASADPLLPGGGETGGGGPLSTSSVEVLLDPSIWRKRTNRRLKCGGLTLLFAFGFLAVALALPAAIDSQITAQTYLVGYDSPQYANFINTTTEWSDVYMFNVTNPVAIVHSNAKPVLDELGPYRYQKVQTRFFVNFDNHRVRYNSWNYLVFAGADEALGYRDENEIVVSPNIPLYIDMTQTNLKSNDNAMSAWFVWVGTRPTVGTGCDPCYPGLLYNQTGNDTETADPPAVNDEGTGVFFRASVHTLLFGFESTILEKTKDQVCLLSEEQLPELQPLCDLEATYYPGSQGNMTAQDGLDDGVSVMYSGKANDTATKYYYQYNGMEDIMTCKVTPCNESDPDTVFPLQTAWAESYVDGEGERVNSTANTVFGHDVSQIPPHSAAGTSVEIFFGQVMRAIAMENKNGATSTVKGIDTMKYTIAENQLMNSSEYPPNAAYFQDTTPRGLLNISAVKSLAPIYVSKAYFLDADESLGDGVLMCVDGDCENTVAMGSLADEDQHDTVLNIYKEMGWTVQATSRLQINARLPGSYSMEGYALQPFGPWERTFFPNMTQTYIPVYYTELTGEVTDDQSDLITRAVHFKKVFFVGGLAMFFALLTLGAYLVTTGYLQRKADQPHSRCFRFRHLAPPRSGASPSSRPSVNCGGGQQQQGPFQPPAPAKI